MNAVRNFDDRTAGDTRAELRIIRLPNCRRADGHRFWLGPEMQPTGVTKMNEQRHHRYLDGKLRSLKCNYIACLKANTPDDEHTEVFLLIKIKQHSPTMTWKHFGWTLNYSTPRGPAGDGFTTTKEGVEDRSL